MMAQDFHDLTGQVVAKVVALAADLEDSLVKLLVQAAPPEQAQKVEPGDASTARWSTPKAAPTWSPTRARSTTCWPAWASDPQRRDFPAGRAAISGPFCLLIRLKFPAPAGTMAMHPNNGVRRHGRPGRTRP